MSNSATIVNLMHTCLLLATWSTISHCLSTIIEHISSIVIQVLTIPFSSHNLHTDLEIKTTDFEQTTNVEVTLLNYKACMSKPIHHLSIVQCNWQATWIKFLLHIFMIQWLDHNLIIHEIENEWGKNIYKDA